MPSKDVVYVRYSPSKMVDTDEGDFHNRVVNSGILTAGLHTRVQPRQDKIQVVTLLDLIHELINRGDS